MKKKINTNGGESKKGENIYPFIITSVLIFITWIVSYILISHSFDEGYRGTFGDSFGAVNALFSGIALAGIIYTILLQRKELNLQRSELILTRDEFKMQNQTLKQQRFENTFFHMLSLHNEIIDKLSYEKEGITYKGRDFFEAVYYELGNKNAADLSVSYIDDNDTWSAIEEEYNYVFNQHRASLSHYFRNLYHIFKYVYLSDLIMEEDKQFYASLVRAQLSTFELGMIFYNSLVKGLGYPKFKYLIDIYDLIQNMSDSILLNINHWNFHCEKEVKNPF